eukprot:785839-Prymnesium_polylepis.1
MRIFESAGSTSGAFWRTCMLGMSMKKNVTSSFAKRARPGARATASRALAVVDQEGDQAPVR